MAGALVQSDRSTRGVVLFHTSKNAKSPGLLKTTSSPIAPEKRETKL